MRGTVFSWLRRCAKKLLRDKRGNAMFLTAAAIVPVIGIVGSGIDIGRAYMAQLRLQQACDAGVLAGRRAMAAGTYSDSAKAEANKMFNFNFPTKIYGSDGITFASQAQGTADVTGTASARVPTMLMYIFGTSRFNLTVNCTAKLEISNVDVMLVLDVTGSMASTNSGDSVTKIAGLRTAAIDFFDTLSNADIGDGQLRFGVVPYSSSVNVGQILVAKDPDWLADSDLLPSRTPVFVFGHPETETSTQYTDSATTLDTNWTNDGTVTASSQAVCLAKTPPANTTPSPSGSPNYNQTGRYEDAAGTTRVTTYDTTQVYVYRTYRYTWSSNSCRKQYKNARFTRTYITTVTETKDVFDGKYIYQDVNFDVSRVKTGSALEADVGTSGATVSIAWQGCIIERKTVPFAANETAPADAFDMDIDMVPTNSGDDPDDSKWKLFLPAATYSRPSETPYTSTTNSKNFAEKGGDYAACPIPAMNMTKMTKADRPTFVSYINSLQPKGYTYHDAGMAWGARLISPTGLFATENAAATNGKPISRHIVFMTDGDMRTPPDNLSHQGHENSMERVGATGSTATAKENDAIARHNNRFVQLCRAARQRGITIWVVSFGVGSNANLNSCATSGEAYESDDSAQLNENFQSIARQISKLRLSQ